MSQDPPDQPQQPPPQPGQYPNYPQQPMQGQSYPQYPQQPPPGYQFQPPQGPYVPPPKKSHKGLWITLAVVLIVVVALCSIIGIATSSATKTTTTTGTQATPDTSSTSSSSSSSTANHKIGDVVNVDNTWQVTVTSAKTDPGDGQFNIPKSGNVYVLIGVTEKNISDTQQNASGLAQYTLRGTDGTSYDAAIGYGKDPGGKVSAGQPLKGVLAYEVPKGVKQFTLNFQSDLASDQTTWDINL